MDALYDSAFTIADDIPVKFMKNGEIKDKSISNIWYFYLEEEAAAKHLSEQVQWDYEKDFLGWQDKAPAWFLERCKREREYADSEAPKDELRWPPPFRDYHRHQATDSHQYQKAATITTRPSPPLGRSRPCSLAVSATVHDRGNEML